MTQARIMVVEDEPIGALIIRESLIELGYEVCALIDNAEEALVQAAELKPDLVLMDIMLKGEMNGIQAADRLRASLEVPVIYLTVYGDPLTIDQAKITEPYAYILKPFEKRDLHSSIEIALYKHRSEKKLKTLSEELFKARKLEALGVVAGGMAHEFNNLLAIINTNLELINLHFAPCEEGLRAQVAKIDRAYARARDLTYQLLTFAQGGVPVKQKTNLAKVISSSSEKSLTLTAANISYEVQVAPDLWLAQVDEGQIEQALHQILQNAQEAIPPQGGKIWLRATNYQSEAKAQRMNLPLPAGPYIRLSIKDSGSGIEAVHLPQIFDPFFTTKTGRQGLGLAVAYSIIKNHQGYLAVESEPKSGTGTTFFIYLPALTETIPVLEFSSFESTNTTNAITYTNGGDKPLGAISSQKIKKRILVMDDEKDLRETMAEMLEYLDFEAVLARDGVEALECYVQAKLSGHPVDLVIMDLTIPGGMGGKEAIRRLLELDPHAKAIVSSGYSNDPVMAYFKVYGFKAVMPKPYSMKQLEKTIHSILE